MLEVIIYQLERLQHKLDGIFNYGWGRYNDYDPSLHHKFKWICDLTSNSKFTTRHYQLHIGSHRFFFEYYRPLKQAVAAN